MVVQDAERPTPPLAAAEPSTGPVSDDFLPDRAVASVLGAEGGIAADAPTVAGRGYRRYGGMVLPADRTVEMVTEVAPGTGWAPRSWNSDRDPKAAPSDTTAAGAATSRS